MRRAIVLERVPGGVRFALWAEVPVEARPYYARPGAASVWRGASPQENRAIETGQVAESVGVVPTAAARGAIEALWAEYRARVAADATWAEYGASWDGSAWST